MNILEETFMCKRALSCRDRSKLKGMCVRVRTDNIVHPFCFLSREKKNEFLYVRRHALLCGAQVRFALTQMGLASGAVRRVVPIAPI